MASNDVMAITKWSISGSEKKPARGLPTITTCRLDAALLWRRAARWRAERPYKQEPRSGSGRGLEFRRFHKCAVRSVSGPKAAIAASRIAS